MVYLIGSLANPKVIEVTNRLQHEGFEPFSQWQAAGEGADQRWWDYAQKVGWSFQEALDSAFVQTAFDFDMRHIEQAGTVVMVMPAGRSAGIELGWALGQGKKGYILYDGVPERPDLMIKLATGVCFSIDELVERLQVDEKMSSITNNAVPAPYCTVCGAVLESVYGMLRCYRCKEIWWKN